MTSRRHCIEYLHVRHETIFKNNDDVDDAEALVRLQLAHHVVQVGRERFDLWWSPDVDFPSIEPRFCEMRSSESGER